MVGGLVATFRTALGGMLKKFMLKDCHKEIKDGLVDNAFVGEQLHAVFVKPRFANIAGKVKVIYTKDSEDSLIDPKSLVSVFGERPNTTLVPYDGPYCTVDGLNAFIS